MTEQSNIDRPPCAGASPTSLADTVGLLATMWLDDGARPN